MKTPDTMRGWLLLFIALATFLGVMWAAVAFSVEYHDREMHQTMESIDSELRIQGCQRLKRAEGETYEIAQRSCAQEERER